VTPRMCHVAQPPRSTAGPPRAWHKLPFSFQSCRDQRSAVEESSRQTSLAITQDPFAKMVGPVQHHEPLLAENPDRFCMFPIKYSAVWEMYKKAEASFWTGRCNNGRQTRHWPVVKNATRTAILDYKDLREKCCACLALSNIFS
jgi:hypothetical protein